MRGIRLFVLACVLLAAPSALAQTISFLNQPDLVGSGLQAYPARARLSDSQHGGILVTVSVSDSTLILVAPDDHTPGVPELDVFVPNGSVDAYFVVQALRDTTGTATIEAQAPGFSPNSFDVDIVTPVVELGGVATARSVIDPEDPFTVRVGLANSAGTGLGTAQRARVGDPGFLASVTSSDPSVLTLRTSTESGGTVSVLVPPGEYSVSGAVADGLQAGTAQASVSIEGFDLVDNSTQTITYEAAAIGLVGLPGSVGAGLRSGQLRARLNGSAHGGTTIDITSGDPSRVLLSEGQNEPGTPSLSIFVDDGSIDANFYVHGLEGVTGVVPITANSAGIIGDAEDATVVTPSFRLNGLTTVIDTLDPPDAFSLQVGYSSNGSNWTATQPARPGGPGIDGFLYVVDPTVGQITNSTESADSLAFRLEPGESSTPGSINVGGFGFDGVGAGTTDVTAAIPGFVPADGSVRTVTVTQPTIAWIGTTYDLGSGLQSAELRTRLSATDHGGVTVTIAVDDPSLGLVAADGTDPGAASIDVFVPDGSTDGFFHLNALEAQTGTLGLTASAPGFTTSMTTVDIVDPRIEIQTGTLLSNVTTLSPPDPFTVRIGWIAGSNFFEQKLRPGSPGLTITVDVDDPSVGQVQNSTTTAATVQLDLGAGESKTPPTLNDGGVAFAPVGVGSVDVTASAPGFVPGANATRTVNVSAPSMTLFGLVTDIGAGLQSTNRYAQLITGAHGGVTVHIESADPGVLLIAPDAATAGAAFQDVFVPDGQTRAYFTLQAIDGTTGSVQVSANCPGFTGTSDFVDVVQPGLEIEYLGAAAGVSDPDDPFRVRIGVPDNNGSSVQYRQERRAGAEPLTVQLASSNAAVGELVTLAATGPTVELSIGSGQEESPNTVTGGGVAFRPIGGGSTLVSAVIGGFFATGDATREVQVAVDGIALVSVPAQVGAGLTGGPVLARLGNAAHGGTMVTITSDDPTRARVAPDLVSSGSESINVFVVSGQTDASFFVLGQPGAAGTVNVFASASGFNTNARPLEVVTPALQIVGLPDSVVAGAPNVPFRVQVGIPDATAEGLAQLQIVNAGGPPISFTVEAAGAGTGLIEVTGSKGSSKTAGITAGTAETGTTLATGGLEFDPVYPGTLNVSATSPGTMAVAHSVVPIRITGTVVAVGDVPTLDFGLRRASPNPFNPQTTIAFSLTRKQSVRLKVVDVAGRIVRTLWDGGLDAGTHRMVWDGRDGRGSRVASGVYLSVLKAEEGTRTGKMVLVK
jgi:hypothetical protein